MRVSLFLCQYLAFIVLECLTASSVANSVSTLQPSCADHERLALLQFKSSFHTDCSVSVDPLGGYTPYPKLKSWIDGENADCCSWDGVECNNKTGHVIGLDLTCSCLYGTFPSNSSLFSLAHLEKLKLPFNDFNRSHIPSALGQLTNLRYLDLFDSAFSGQIPAAISRLSKLSNLEIGDSTVGGNPNLKLENPSLEKLVQNLTCLQKLYLMNIDISSTLPKILTNLTSLQILGCQFCNLYGELPQNLFHLPNIEMIDFDGNNNLQGSLPQFQGHSTLSAISLSSTAVSGRLPPSIGRLARLEEFDISDCQFSGLIPSSLGNLTALVTLDLSVNSFKGDISFSFTNLRNLDFLDLSDLNVTPGQLLTELPKLQELTCLAIAGVHLGTQIPHFLASLTGLAYLDLTNTQLFGPFPEWFSNLTQLVELGLAENQLEGPIPQWFSQFTNLKFLDLSYNNLFGKFETFADLNNLRFLNLSGVNLTFPPPSRVHSSLTKLNYLGLSSCNLTEFPEFLRYQTELQCIVISGNLIKGSIPQWFVNMSKDTLLAIDLSDNYLTGFQPPVVVLPWSRLKLLDLHGNEFQCSLPTPPTTMQTYDVSNNRMTGAILHQMCEARHLISLDLSRNNISGQIPQCLSNQLGDSLEFLNLRGNNLHGTIPQSFTASCKLKMINLSENRLEGKLPRSLVNCTELEVLDIGKNEITDTFPNWLGSLRNLQVLVLRHNNFHGIVSDWESKAKFTVLRIIDLSHNLHTGGLPSEYIGNWHAMTKSNEGQSDSSYTLIHFNLIVASEYLAVRQEYEYSITITDKGSERLYSRILKVFRVIDFSSNNFTGRIPDVIGDLKGLQALNLSNNNLEGPIPPSVANIEDLESLDLSRNVLSGVIPLKLSQITSLEALNVSYNHLVGPIPQGEQFDTFDNSSYKGNFGLCGIPLWKRCGNVDVAPSPPVTSDETYEESRLIDWIIRSMGWLSGFIVGFIIGKYYITDKYDDWFVEMFGKRPRKRGRRVRKQRR